MPAGDGWGDLYEERLGDRQWRRDLWQVLVDRFFHEWLDGQETVLDYGSGFGEFINAVDAVDRIGVDLRPDAEAHLADGVRFHVPDAVRVPDVEDGSVDVVFCSNVLEHLESREQILELLSEFHRVLRPDGRLLLLGPNARFCGPEYWDFFDHRISLTDRSVAEALLLAGFRVERSIPRFLPYTTVGRRNAPLALVRLYLGLPFAWRLFGGQFFIVAEPVQ